jgi:CRP-like cAMP-binding protein
MHSYTYILDMSSKTAADLIAMGSTLLALTPSEILSITNETFLDAVAEISEMQGFSTEQLQAWASKAALVSIVLALYSTGPLGRTV